MASRIHCIIVTHNSAEVLATCLDCLDRQTVQPATITLVDSGSDDPAYLEGLTGRAALKVIQEKNIGFSAANNRGYRSLSLDPQDIVVFLNPDTFLESDFFANMVDSFAQYPVVAVMSGKLLGFDRNLAKPTGRIDSAGIFRRWYGRWYDRGHGAMDNGEYERIEEVPALCGALLCCRVSALIDLGGGVFDEDFFLYKEDIELSLRLRKKGHVLQYDPRLVAYHCRGWQAKRRSVALGLRKMSARNEILLYRKHPSPYIFWALLKYIVVQVFKV